MNPLIVVAVVGGLLLLSRKRATPEVSSGPACTLSQVVGDADATAVFVELGTPLNLCGATEMQAIVVRMDLQTQEAVPAPLVSFTRNGDLFTFHENGVYVVAGSNLERAWIVGAGIDVPTPPTETQFA